MQRLGDVVRAKSKYLDRELCILDSASVSLLPGITIEADGLRDIDGRLYAANSVGRFTAAAVHSPIPVRSVAEALAEHFQIDQQTARRDLNLYLDDLDARRLVSIRQSFLKEFRVRLWRVLSNLFFALVLQFRHAPVRYPNRRYRPSARRVLLASLEAYQSMLAIGALVLLLIGGLYAVRNLRLGLPAADTLSILTMVVLAVYFLGLIGSGVLHELGHYFMARRLKVPMLSVFARMGVAGLTHVADEPAKTAAIAAAGPLAGAVIPLAFMVGAWYMPVTWLGPLTVPGANVGVAASWACIAILQLRNLTPFTAEGRLLAVSVFRALARRRTHQAVTP